MVDFQLGHQEILKLASGDFLLDIRFGCIEGIQKVTDLHTDAHSEKLTALEIKAPRRARHSNTGGSGEIRTRDQRIKSPQNKIFISVDLCYQVLVISKEIIKYMAYRDIFNIPLNSLKWI